MKLVEQSLKYGVTVAVGVILILMFGIMALLRIPVQLTPEISQPELSIRTTWPGASQLAGCKRRRGTADQDLFFWEAASPKKYMGSGVPDFFFTRSRLA